MADARSELRRHVEGIIAELSSYMQIRFEQLARIRPSLRSMYPDLIWMQTEKVRGILVEEKMIGGLRIPVVEILAGRDEAKRRAMQNPIDQSSIMSELVPDEESMERRPGQVSVRSVRGLYMAVDSTLNRIIEVIDIWLWWDIFDAANAHGFKEQKALIERRRTEPLGPEHQDHYMQAMARREEREITREEILSFEYAYLESLWRAFMVRRTEERSYMLVIQRDSAGESGLDDLILTLGRHIAARRKLNEPGGFDGLREYYARAFRADPAHVTVEQAAASEDQAIARLRDELHQAFERDEALGEAYNYKRAQAEQMAREIEQYRHSLPLIEEVVKASMAATVRSTAPGAQPPAPGRPEPRAPQRPPLVEPESDQPFVFGGM
jgi:hypothetical protein